MSNKILINESVYNQLLIENIQISQIKDSIDNHNLVEIYYQGDKETIKGRRTIEVYAIGVTKSGNACIRAYQLYGKTTTINEEWKIFRLDRITRFSILNNTFDQPRPNFNKNGDNALHSVSYIASF